MERNTAIKPSNSNQKMKIKIALFLCLYGSLLYSQDPSTPTNPQKIITLLHNYFKLDREYIHVQFNKDVYVTNEIIGFKGFILSKNEDGPNMYTSNINLVVYDNNNQVVKRQLIYANNAAFSGTLQLNDNFKSGLYHFRFHTNWMNNFNEDYTYTQTIEIINSKAAYTMPSKKPKWQTATVHFTPESGAIIDNVYNTVGIKIKDCNHKGIKVDNIVITDSKSSMVAKCNTNTMGYGYFTFLADKDEKYFLTINNDNLKINEPLPLVAETGIAISYNTNLPKNKLAIVVKTNEKGIEKYTNKKYTLLIHQNEKSVLKEFVFTSTETEHTLIFDKTIIPNGVNSIRLIDDNLNQITEKLYYNPLIEKPIQKMEIKKLQNDSISIVYKNELAKTNLCISVIPNKNISDFGQKTILGTFYLNNHLKKPEAITNLYFDPENPNKKNDLDALMHNQSQNKIEWETIKTKIPKITYPFSKGVTIRGKVESNTTVTPKSRLILISTLNQVNEQANINAKGEFKFENFFAQDSTVYITQVTNEKGIAKRLNIVANVINNEKKCVFPFEIEQPSCLIINEDTDEKFTFKTNTTELSTVYIQLDKKEVLLNKHSVNNTANGQKINEQHGTIMDYLNVNGFDTGRNTGSMQESGAGNTYIQSRSGFNRGETPAIRINQLQVQDLSELYTIPMADVDEIYIDRDNARYIGTRTVIDIFLKTGKQRSSGFTDKHKLFTVSNGYANSVNFKNANFETLEETRLFGTLGWESYIELENNEEYQLKLPLEYQKDIRVLIEGLAADGQLISEIQTISFDK